VLRSDDGVTWSPVVEGTAFGWVIYGHGTYLAGQRYSPQRSTDGGQTWTVSVDPAMTLADGGTDYHVRKAGFAPYGSGRWIFVGNEDVILSSDAGDSWWHPVVVPRSCAGANGGVAYGNGTLVIGSGTDIACASADGGETWAEVSVTGSTSLSTPVVWDGSQFVVWSESDDMRWTSPDGESWTGAPIATPIDFGSVAANPETGTFVAESGGWMRWYEQQSMYRSTDGLTWTEITGFPGGHDLRDLQFGHLAPSATCP
jgi:hypothetical protein